jgi:hypothetical protein
MKELARFNIEKADSRFKKLLHNDIEEKIDLIYMLGYAYNPYKHTFLNPFIDKEFKADLIYDMSLDYIKKNHKESQLKYLLKNLRIKSFDKTMDSIYSNGPSTMFLNTESLGGIIGVILLILSIILHFCSNIFFALGSLILSFIFVNLYLKYNTLYSKEINDELLLSPFWRRFKKNFLLLRIPLFIYLYYILFIVLDSYWIPGLIIYSMNYFAEKFVIRHLSLSYWGRHYYSFFEEYAEKNGFS